MKFSLSRALASILCVVLTAFACDTTQSSNTDGGADNSADDSSGGGSACENDAECESEGQPYCGAAAGCVACVINAHCSEGEQCSDGECETGTLCTGSSECTKANEPVCDYATGTCVGCVISLDCGESSICSEGKCEAVTTCVNSLDCPTDAICNREAGYCVECLGDSDCDEANTCVDQACIPRCDTDKECSSSDRLCNTEVGHCVECVEHVDCPDSYYCSEGSCVADECVAGAGTCLEGVDALSLCDSYGASVEIVNCPPSSACIDNGAGAFCSAWECIPGAATCDPTGATLRSCDADGQAYSLVTDCAQAGGVCENNACVDVQCAPDSRFCSENLLVQCSSSGSQFTSIQTCPQGTFCDAEEGGCFAHQCAPESASCNGNIVEFCDSIGSGLLDATVDCSENGENCFGGVCRSIVCESDTNYCKGGDAYSCTENGTSEVLSDNCTASEYCEAGTCIPTSCTPATPACAGELTGVCNAEGSGVDTSSGTDCAAETDMACYGGNCLDVICEGTSFCEEQTRRSCTLNGTSSSLLSTCTASQFCSESGGVATCQSQLCTPDALACDGNRATTCLPDGSGYAAGGTTCTAQEFCVGGSCLPVICMANAYYCESGNVMRCGSDGTTTTQTDTCSTGEYCLEGASSCQLDQCTAGQPTCDGNQVATCADDGSGPLDDGVACGVDEACASGACLPITCEPGLQYCEENFRRTCNATGTGYSSSVTCSTATFCAESSPGVTACFQDICEPATATCDGETLATCGDDGGSFVDPLADCSTTSQLCDGTTCVDSVVETVGGTTTNSTSYCSNYRVGNRYTFTTPRTLTNIEHYLGITTGTIQLTWVIYETTSATGSGTYNSVFERVTTATGTDYHSSGPISFDVEPGKFYLIGVRPAGACSVYYSSAGKQYLSSGYTDARDYESDAGALTTTWSFSTVSSSYAQRLTFE